MHLVASVCLFVCLCVLYWLNHYAQNWSKYESHSNKENKFQMRSKSLNYILTQNGIAIPVQFIFSRICHVVSVINPIQQTWGPLDPARF